ncbi:hypothetical protein [Paucilactobacillus vaccinostercus]|nr:hypothetical protein [Paucilactobacillus vaccinostercus]
MKEARQTISYATVAMIIYCVVSLLMYAQTGTALWSVEVIVHTGIAIALFLIAAVLSAMNSRSAVYVMMLVLLIYTIALVVAFVQVTWHSDASSFIKMLINVLSVIGVVINVLCAAAAVRLRTHQSNFKFLRRK